ncbi:mechanosensitive ion channel domain-containing protein [Maribacter sp. 2210JD10-5]|uniref:mechanosensitive ion channel domain-containing protein n=1 Tax=Maribacter sp. 2210JD10-5 TaxID=3386272 RepID=UPI0039BD84EB
MKTFFIDHQNELLTSSVVIILVIILKLILTKTVRKVGKLGDFNPVRTNLIVKYISIALTIITIATFTLIWGVNYKDLGVLVSSVFAVIGVALFAQWSILSNITAGVIIFFSFPFKIGNTIRILDKELADTDAVEKEVFVIEDIRAFHLHLRKKNGEILTYPNNMILQKGVTLISTYNGQLVADIDEN